MSPLGQLFPEHRRSPAPHSPSPPSGRHLVRPAPARRRREVPGLSAARGPRAVRGVRLRRRCGGAGAAAGPARREEEEEGAPWPRPGPASRRRSCGGCGGSAQVRTGEWGTVGPGAARRKSLGPRHPVTAAAAPASHRPSAPHLRGPSTHTSVLPLSSPSRISVPPLSCSIHTPIPPHSCPSTPLTLPSAPPFTLPSLPSAPAHLCPSPQLSRSVPASLPRAAPRFFSSSPISPCSPHPASLHPKLL